jgi:hypothetical protein
LLSNPTRRHKLIAVKPKAEAQTVKQGMVNKVVPVAARPALAAGDEGRWGEAG